ncbi:MAG TPA: cytochrome B [Ohtaekwangia sp.]
MYPLLLDTHSYLRYFILILLLIVIIRSLLGLINKTPFKRIEVKIALFLLICTHTQLIVGLILYFVSPAVQFGPDTMTTYRYWTVEHIFAMLVAIGLITAGWSTTKRATTDAAKFKKLFIFNTLALVIIVAMIIMSGRGLW